MTNGAVVHTRTGLSGWARLVLGLIVYLSSVGPLVHAGAGAAGMALFTVAFCVVWLGACSPAWQRKAAALGDRPTTRLYATLTVVSVAALLVAIPMTRSGALPLGTKRAFTLTAAVDEVASGRNPYKVLVSNTVHRPTVPGEWKQGLVAGGGLHYPEPVSVLPGLILLAAPFVWLFGYSGYQNALWMVVLVLLARRSTRTPQLGLYTVAVLFAAMPNLSREFLNGSDFFANTVMVLAAIAATERVQGRALRRAALIGAVVGLLLATRIACLPLLGVLGCWLWRREGLQAAVAFLTPAGLVAAGLVLPFVIVDPEWFSPLHVRDRMVWVDAFLPGASFAVQVLTIASVAIACAATYHRPELLKAASAAMLAAPNVVMVLFGLFFAGTPGGFSNWLMPAAVLSTWYAVEQTWSFEAARSPMNRALSRAAASVSSVTPVS